MPTNIKLTCSINAGAPQQGPVDGGIQVDGDDVVQLSHANTSGASKYRFEIVDYPTGVSLTDFPGWSLDGDGRTIYYAGPNPPAFTIPDDSGVWGNWLLRLIVDDGRRTSTTRPGELEVAADLIDATIGLVKPGQVLKDTAFTETLQIDQQRYAVAAMKYNWRALEALAVSAGGEANIASNVGTGVGVYDSKDGVEFLFRSILAGTGINVQLVDGGDGLHDIRISATGAGGGGGGGGIPYTFDTGTGASNPGDGELRFNDATYLSATSIHINDEDANGADMTGFIPTWDDSTSTIKGILIITSGSTAIMVAAVTAVAANSGYYTVSITPLAADGTFPTDPGALRVLFCPKGDKGDGGATGAAGANGTDGDRGEPGGESYRFTHNSGSVDPDADPGAGQVVFDDADETAATEIAVDVEDALGRDISDWLDSLDDAAGAFKGRLRAYSWEDPSLFIEYTLTSVTSASGYRKLGVTYLYGPGGFGNDAGDLVLSFARPGDGTDGLPGGESFFWNHKQDTSDSDPLNGNLKLNATLAKDATSMMIDPINQDGSIMTDWLDSWLGGHTVTITYVTNPLAFVIFEVDTIVNVGGYHKVSFRRTIRGGNFQFGEDAQLLVSLSRGGAGGSGGGSGTGAGSANGMMAVLDAWRRVHHPSPSTPHASDRLGLWVPGFNHWIKLEFDSLDGPESTGIGDGGIHVAVMAGAEGGLTGAIHSRDFPGGWMSHGSVAAAELHSPLCATAVQVVSSGGQTTYVFVGASRMEGFGSASGKLFRSTDGGKTFTSYDLQRSDTVGPSLILWTGTRLVVSYNASGGQVETSEATSIGNLGTSWTGRTVPNSKARRWGATNGSGTVVLVGEDEDFLYSTDHGATWTAGSFGDFDDAKPVGCVFCNGRFYVLLDSQAMLTSEDGISWLGPTLPSFSYATETSNLKPIRDKCFRAHGDLLVCFWKDESSPPDDYKTDVYYCNTTEFPEGTHWTRSGAFGKRYLVDATYRPRIQLVTSSADSPAHNNQRRTQIDRLQMLFFADQGDFSAGGGQYAECWVSPMDVVRRGGAGTTSPGGSGGGSTGSGNALIRQLFNQQTTMAAPGDARFRLNNALPSLATAAAFDDLTVDNIDVEAFLNPDNTFVATIHNSDFSVWHQFDVSGHTNNSGWTQWTIGWIAGEGEFVDGEEYSIEYDLVGSGGSDVTAATNEPQPVAASASLGAVTARFAREDHAHAHGDQSGGTLHAVVGASAGFMPGTSGASEGDIPVVQNDGSVAYEASSVPLVSDSGPGLMPSTSGVSDGWIPVVQSDGSVAYESAGAPTDHGGLTGLGDDDHAIYLLASGSRALAGTWSLGGNPLTNVGNLTATGTPTWNLNGGDLTNVDDIVMAGSNSVITMNGGDISGLDDLTFAGSGSTLSQLAVLNLVSGGGTMSNVALIHFTGASSWLNNLGTIVMSSAGLINMNDGTIENVDGIEFNGAGSEISGLGTIKLGSESASFPSAGSNETIARGHSSAIGGLDVRGQEWAHVLAAYQKNASASNGTTIGQSINMANIKGINFGSGVARMRVVLVSVSNTPGAGYAQQYEEAWYIINTRTGTTCAVSYLMQQPEIWSPTLDQDAAYFRSGGTTTTERITISETGQYTFTVTGTVSGSTSTTWTARLMVWIEGVCQ